MQDKIKLIYGETMKIVSDKKLKQLNSATHKLLTENLQVEQVVRNFCDILQQNPEFFIQNTFDYLHKCVYTSVQVIKDKNKEREITSVACTARQAFLILFQAIDQHVAGDNANIIMSKYDIFIQQFIMFENVNNGLKIKNISLPKYELHIFQDIMKDYAQYHNKFQYKYIDDIILNITISKNNLTYMLPQYAIPQHFDSAKSKISYVEHIVTSMCKYLIKMIIEILATGYSGEKVHDILNQEKKIFTCVVVLNKIDEQHMLFQIQNTKLAQQTSSKNGKRGPNKKPYAINITKLFSLDQFVVYRIFLYAKISKKQ